VSELVPNELSVTGTSGSTEEINTNNAAKDVHPLTSQPGK